MPGLSLLYGFLFAGLCAGIYLLISGIPWYTTGYLTGLVVVGLAVIFPILSYATWHSYRATMR